MRIVFYSLILFLLTFSCAKQNAPSEEDYTTVRSIKAENAQAMAKQIRESVAVQVADGMELSLWASDSLIHDPIAISIDSDGKIYYTSATRQENSEFDIRGHRNWMTASISFETPEDRLAFLKETFTVGSEESQKHLKDLNNDGVLDWRDLTVEKEEIWWVADKDEDGVAESAHLYIKDFHEAHTDVANGVLAHDGDVYVAVAPDLMKVSDEDGDGTGDKIESLSRGYAVHIGFSGHGMSGVTVGPQGRIWWGIGDIGMNVTDKEGNKWEYPHQGVIVRSEPDGTNFEVYAAGLRNTHEFVFDKYGNLITEDNDGDHRGERERLMYVVHGSDAGWRANWQYGKYTDPDNNDYKVWMDERLSVPKWEGQAAYIIPPIQNYVNGPTGMVYNPGTALSEKWNEHFFIAEFRGNPANSPIHAFTMEQDGAGFKLGQTQEVVSGLLPTGLDFGPDGALYFGDWIDGWNTKDEGRIWKLDVPESERNTKREETKRHLQRDFSAMSAKNLIPLLSYPDMRVRLKAQRTLADKGDIAAFHTVISENKSQISVIHGIWGVAQIARRDQEEAAYLLRLIDNKDDEIKAQAVKMLGDVRYVEAAEEIVPLLEDPSPRVQMFAAEALARMKYDEAKEELVDLLRKSNNEDVYLRHMASFALSQIGDASFLADLNTDPSEAVRLGAVVALRRMEDENVKIYLTDPSELVVTEAARAINDDNSIPGALPRLAEILNSFKFDNEALIRRAINANFRIGNDANVDHLITFASDRSNPAAMRAEALASLSTWENPSVLDRVDGRNRGLKPRNASYAISQLESKVEQLANERNEEIQIAAIQVISQLGINDKAELLKSKFENERSPEVRIEALKALSNLEYEGLDQVLETALASTNENLRAEALSLIPESSLEEEAAINLFTQILEDGTIVEKQSTYAALSKYEGEATDRLISEQMVALRNGEIEREVQLDLLEAVGDSIASEYHSSKNGGALSAYEETLYGGNKGKGRNIFYRNAEAQCVRCHSIFEWGGDAGPGLAGIGNKLTKEQLLESLILPSARLAPGFGVLSVELNDGSNVAGVMEEETDDAYLLKVSKDEVRNILKSEIKAQEYLPSSMPAMDKILDKKEIRDLIAFLNSLQGEEQ
ncbi:HEAT repeat domain-containing protein [Portibacter marinus]|uniref:HEAT repeat domain-containing protein n=1 Tax=Portibacter marinus TaxID=2898660 RepID=UPI001F24DA92|nr:HEAT repeat domain-containing protein [Portibacter marinus]